MKYLVAIFFVFGLYACKSSRQIQPAIVKKNTALQIPYHPLQTEQDLDVLIKEIGDARIVLLGEGSHGTSEYYTWRAAISKKLITEKGFNFIAVEGDWTDCYKINRFIKGEKKDSAAVINVLKEFNRWPTWLWANYEVASLVSWLNNYNQKLAAKDKIGFYGLDLFNISEAASEILPYLKPTDTAAIKAVKNFIQCFKPYANNEQGYVSTLSRRVFHCDKQADNLWHSVAQLVPSLSPLNEDDLALQQNALVAFDGEMYLRTASNSIDSWNFRDNHMAETIDRILNLYGPNSKAIIWAHNNHVGDAKYGTQHWTGKTSLGQLLRNKYGEKNIFIVGSGSYQGSVIAAEKWGTAYQVMRTPPADDSSWEQRVHQVSAENKIILSRELKGDPSMLRWFSHVGIGVLYHPMDRYGIYSLSVIPNRYDAFLYFDYTTALHPIETPVKTKESLGKTPIDY